MGIIQNKKVQVERGVESLIVMRVQISVTRQTANNISVYATHTECTIFEKDEIPTRISQEKFI